jgi:hypothetical protein
MTVIAIFDLILKLVGVLVPLLGGLGAFLYWMLKKALETRFAQHLEKTKHDLQLELEKMTVVFEHQKDSFHKILIAMHHATDAIGQNIQGDGGDWLPISGKDMEAFKHVVSEECLLMDADTDHSLELFSSIMWSSVRDEYFGNFPDSDDVRRAYSQMMLIANRVASHFRSRIGLIPDNSEALLDVELLGACRLINTYHFSDKMPTSGPLKFRDGETAEEMVATARTNLALLKSELEILKNCAAGAIEGGRSYFFLTIAEVDRYIKILNGLGRSL